MMDYANISKAKPIPSCNSQQEQSKATNIRNRGVDRTSLANKNPFKYFPAKLKAMLKSIFMNFIKKVSCVVRNNPDLSVLFVRSLNKSSRLVRSTDQIAMTVSMLVSIFSTRLKHFLKHFNFSAIKHLTAYVLLNFY